MFYSTLKEENLKNISIDTEKFLIKLNNIIKSYSKLGTEGNFLKLIKDNYGKHLANIIPNVNKLSSPKISNKCLLSPLLLNNVLEVLTNAINEEKEIKGLKIRKEQENYGYLVYDYVCIKHYEILKNRMIK